MFKYRNNRLKRMLERALKIDPYVEIKLFGMHFKTKKGFGLIRDRKLKIKTR